MASQPPLAAPAPAEGMHRTHRRTDEVQVFQGGQWVSQGAPQSAVPMPQPVVVRPANPLRQRAVELDVANSADTLRSRQADDARAAESLRLQQEAAARAARGEDRQQVASERLPENAANTLRDIAGMARSLRQAREGFRPEYAGNFFGNTENTLEANLPSLGLHDPGQRDWWAMFRRTDASERNALFGASLTPSEQASFAETTITPSMSAEAVNENLGRRYEAALNAARRQRAFLLANGYRQEAVDALLGPDLVQLLEQGGAPEQSQEPGRSTAPAAAATSGGGGRTPQPPTFSDRSAQPTATGPAGGQEFGGATRSEPDPALAGINRRVSAMLTRNIDGERIKAYLRSVGVEPSNTNLDAMLAWRNTPDYRTWRRSRPNDTWSVELEMRDVPVSGARQALATLGDNPVGAHVMATGNMLTGQRLDQVVGAVTGQPEVAQAGMEEIRRRNPVGSFTGDATGAVILAELGQAGLARLGVGGTTGAGTLGAFSPRAIATDVGIGAYEGSGIDRENPIRGGIVGGLTGGGTGVLARGGINALGRVVAPTGGRVAPILEEGGPVSPGQRIGGAANFVEQAAGDIPLLGMIPRAARGRGQDNFQRAVFNRALTPIGRELPEGVQTGPRAHAFMQRAFNEEFRDIRSGLSFAPDGDFATAFGAIQREISQASSDELGMFQRTVTSQLGGRLGRSNGTLSGDQYVRAVSKISARAREAAAAGRTDLANALNSLTDALDDAAIRQAGPRGQQLAQRLTNARQGYSHAVTIERASARPGGDVAEFTPAQLEREVSRSGGLRSREFLRGDAPLQDLVEAGRQVADTLPQSGTPARLAAMGGANLLTFGPAAGAALGWIPADLAALAATPAGLAVLANFPVVRQLITSGLNPQNVGPVREFLRRQIERYGQLPAEATAAGAAGGAVSAVAQ